MSETIQFYFVTGLPLWAGLFGGQLGMSTVIFLLYSLNKIWYFFFFEPFYPKKQPVTRPESEPFFELPKSQERILSEEHAIATLQAIKEAMLKMCPVDENDKYIAFVDTPKMPLESTYKKCTRNLQKPDKNGQFDWETLKVERFRFFMKRTFRSEQQYIILKNVKLFERVIANVISLNFDNSSNLRIKIREINFEDDEQDYISFLIERRRKLSQQPWLNFTSIDSEDEIEGQIEEVTRGDKPKNNHKFIVNKTDLVKAMIRWNLANYKDRPRFSIRRTTEHYSYAVVQSEVEQISKVLSAHGILLPQDSRKNLAKPIDLDMAAKFLAGEIEIDFYKPL